MISFNTEQVQCLQSDALESFLVEMEAWAIEKQGALIASLAPDTIRNEVMRARGLGFVLRGHVKAWLSLGFELGMPLAASGPAEAIAKDEAIAPAVRLDILEREAVVVLLKDEHEEMGDAV